MDRLGSHSNAGDLPDVQENTDDCEESAEIDQHESGSELNNKFASASEGIAEDHLAGDGGIAENSVRRDQPVSADSDNHGNRGGVELNVPAIDDRSIMLSDIERHERSIGRSQPSRGIGSRATAAPDEAAPGLNTGSQGVEDTPRARPRDERTNYELRRQPKKTKFFGNPISSLLKRGRK